MKRTHRIICFLLSISFLIYAASPLSAIYEQNDSVRQDSTAFFGIRLFIVEMLLSPQSHEDDGEETSSRVLLRKKRANISSGKLKIPKKQINNFTISPGNIVSSEPSCVWLVAHDNEVVHQKISHRPHSGLSPPSV